MDTAACMEKNLTLLGKLKNKNNYDHNHLACCKVWPQLYIFHYIVALEIYLFVVIHLYFLDSHHVTSDTSVMII